MKLLCLLMVLSFEVFAFVAKINVQDLDGDVSHGHGFLFDGNLLLTSYHVIEDSVDFKIAIGDKSFDADLLGFDEVLDIAVVEVLDGNFNKTVNFADEVSSEIIVKTIFKELKGLVKNQTKYEMYTNVDIIKGFSGAPILCNSKICGVITSFDVKTGDAIGTKVLASDIERIKLMSIGKRFYKKSKNLHVVDLNESMLRSLRLHPKTTKGVMIVDSANEKLQPWDIITNVNDKNVHNVVDLYKTLGKSYTEEVVSISLIRDGKDIVIII